MMGEGFVLMQSTDVKLHYYQDEPGILYFDFLPSNYFGFY